VGINLICCWIHGYAVSVDHEFSVVQSVKNSGITDKGAIYPFGKLNVRTGPPLAYILIFSIFLDFSRLLFFLHFLRFFVFSGSVDIHIIQIHYHIVTYFLSIGKWPLLFPAGPLQLRFASVAQTSSYATVLEFDPLL